MNSENSIEMAALVEIRAEALFLRVMDEAKMSGFSSPDKVCEDIALPEIELIDSSPVKIKRESIGS